jgi:hypothetical protein
MNATFPESSYHPKVRLDEQQAKAWLWINAGVGIPFRHVSAALHAAAMAAELETGRDERWVIGVELSSDSRGVVYIETMTGTTAEAQRGAEVLRRAMARVFTKGA